MFVIIGISENNCFVKSDIKFHFILKKKKHNIIVCFDKKKCFVLFVKVDKTFSQDLISKLS